MDCIWSDPASEDQEPTLDPSGFGPSKRGGGAVCFGMAAIEHFLETNNLSFIIRAHEAHAYGVSIGKGARYCAFIIAYCIFMVSFIFISIIMELEYSPYSRRLKTIIKVDLLWQDAYLSTWTKSKYANYSRCY